MNRLLSLAVAALFALLSFGANAACDVSLVSVLSGNQALLAADCGDAVNGIQWFRLPADQPGDIVTGSIGSLTHGANLVVSPPTIAGSLIHFTTPLVPGTHTYSATASTVSGGTVSSGKTPGFTYSLAPTIDDVPDQTVTIGTPFTLALLPHVHNSTGTVHFVYTGSFPNGLSLDSNTGNISGTPNSDAGNSTITWSATDTNGTSAPDQIAFKVSTGTAPTAPTSVTATATGTSGQLSVAFSGQGLGSGTLTNYTADCGGGHTNTGSSSPILVGGLTNGTPANCYVTIATSVNSATSTVFGTATPNSGTPPTAPTAVSAAAGNAQITVTFSGGSLGTGTLTNYTANCTSSGSGAAGSNTGNSSPITVSSLTNGQPYTCTVTTTTSVAPPATSAASNQVSPSAGTPPTAPTTVTAAAGNALITVTFSGGSLGTGTLTNYTANCTSSGSGAAGSNTGSSSPITVSSLTNGQPYTCAVTTTTSVAPPATSAASNQVSPSAGTPPTAPTTVTAAGGNAQITVTFSGGSQGTGTLTNYAANCTSSGSGVAGSNTGSSSPITVSSLTNGQPYTCTVTVTTSVPPAATSAASTSVTPSATCSGGAVWANFVRPGQTTGGTLSGGQTAGTASYSFVMDPSANNGLFANGAKILGEVSGSYYNSRDTVVADCPNVFDTPPAVPQGMTANTLTNCGRMGTMYPNIYLGYTNNSNTQLFYSCNLQPGQTYYLNMRSNYDATSGTYLPAGYLISSQAR